MAAFPVNVWCIKTVNKQYTRWKYLILHPVFSYNQNFQCYWKAEVNSLISLWSGYEIKDVETFVRPVLKVKDKQELKSTILYV